MGFTPFSKDKKKYINSKALDKLAAGQRKMAEGERVIESVAESLIGKRVLAHTKTLHYGVAFLEITGIDYQRRRIMAISTFYGKKISFPYHKFKPLDKRRE